MQALVNYDIYIDQYTKSVNGVTAHYYPVRDEAQCLTLTVSVCQ